MLLAKFLSLVLTETRYVLTNDLAKQVQFLREKGFKLIVNIDENGAYNLWFAFLHNFSKSRYTLHTCSRSFYFAGTLPIQWLPA